MDFVPSRKITLDGYLSALEVPGQERREVKILPAGMIEGHDMVVMEIIYSSVPTRKSCSY
jgi:hypothetical protein